MQIQLGEIGRKERCYNVPDENWLPVDDVIVKNVTDAYVCVRLTKSGDPVLRGCLAVTIADFCSRCRRSIVYEVAENFHYLVKMNCEAVFTEAERQCSTAECDTVFLERPVLDLAEILREQLLLSLPIRMLCDQDCKGLCPHCGALRHQDVCACGGGESASPFAILETLQKK